MPRMVSALLTCGWFAASLAAFPDAVSLFGLAALWTVAAPVVALLVTFAVGESN